MLTRHEMSRVVHVRIAQVRAFHLRTQIAQRVGGGGVRLEGGRAGQHRVQWSRLFNVHFVVVLGFRSKTRQKRQIVELDTGQVKSLSATSDRTTDVTDMTLCVCVCVCARDLPWALSVDTPTQVETEGERDMLASCL